jgi:chemotaxis response regulator CheB
MLAATPTRVLMIDDAAVVARLLAAELQKSPDIQLIAVARSFTEATEKIAACKPDAILLDLDALRSDCGAFMAQCVRDSLPVIVLTSANDSAAERALEALFQGAVDVICKPDSRQSFDAWIVGLFERIRVARCTTPTIPPNKPGPYLTRPPSASGSEEAVFAMRQEAVELAHSRK